MGPDKRTKTRLYLLPASAHHHPLDSNEIFKFILPAIWCVPQHWRRSHMNGAWRGLTLGHQYDRQQLPNHIGDTFSSISFRFRPNGWWPLGQSTASRAVVSHPLSSRQRLYPEANLCSLLSPSTWQQQTKWDSHYGYGTKLYWYVELGVSWAWATKINTSKNTPSCFQLGDIRE